MWSLERDHSGSYIYIPWQSSRPALDLAPLYRGTCLYQMGPMQHPSHKPHLEAKSLTIGYNQQSTLDGTVYMPLRTRYTVHTKNITVHQVGLYFT